MHIKFKSYLSFLFCLLFVQYAWSQQDSVQYKTGFPFNAGLYFTFQQFRENNPLPKSHVIASYKKTDLDFLKNATSQNKVSYLDLNGKEQQIVTSNLWGYSENNMVYINYKGDFYRIPLVGSLCHFVAYVSTYTDFGGPGFYDNGFGGAGGGTTVQQLQQFILDMQTGNVVAFDVPHMSVLLQRDPELYKEFSALKRRKQKKALFLYLRKYNDKHPLYFPK